eukprot:TRINITY_DN5560_c0_g1::TRINITY_DN5560_c0_g1_i1::g.9414::m.9414 TRINITY_DN5560_c0_g1::TRINITY_DN5560_c0_g1_i1::g.9414  ORF type:complete len:148 (-),score=4.05,sp/Q54CX4/Y5521_DICDI/28.57/2e-08,zf-C3HC4_2/PF13923.1/1.8e-05,zf-C3HC4_2/PF13923.1/4.7e+03,zf-C3HC4_2/PF13923.1/4.9e+02,zf-C3HC4/PF00097.20/5.7e-05,zf-C3HC4/PF00097.20/1.2e+03,zf-C3HC4/PF00097.20/2.8e+03,zf-RING_2/PF13639.1/0.00038,zf-RING_2/PF13639.1/6.1e+02,zf-rbx1/PF12678.2/0.035,zf-rbx1/PF12678.2/1.7e+03,Baculo_RING/PF05883.6/0.22,zf-R
MESHEQDREVVECGVCYQELNDECTFLEVAKCKHMFCTTCITTYVQMKVISSQILSIRCLRPGCPETISHGCIKQCISEPEFDRFVLVYNEKSTEQGFRNFPKCSLLQKGDENKPIMICINPECSTVFCFKHSLAHSPEVSCLKYDR